MNVAHNESRSNRYDILDYTFSELLYHIYQPTNPAQECFMTDGVTLH